MAIGTESTGPFNQASLLKALESLDEVILFLSPKGVIRYVNSAVTRFTGWETAALIGRPIDILERPLDSDEPRPLFDWLRARQYPDGKPLPLIVFNPDGDEAGEVEAAFYAAPRADGAIDGYISAQRPLGSLSGSSRRAIRAGKMEAVAALVAGLAHDFNNLLTPLLGYAQLAKMEQDSDRDPTECLDMVIHAAGKARELMRKTLAFSSLSDAPRLPVDIVRLTRTLIREWRATAPPKVAIREVIEPDTAKIWGDQHSARQLLNQLGRNAVESVSARGWGTVSVELGNMDIDARDMLGYPELGSMSCARIAVRDDGPGVSGAIRDRIFDPFFTTRKRGDGAGVGLSIANGVARSLGGVISFRSEPGGETVFTVLLPRVTGKPGEKPEPLALRETALVGRAAERLFNAPKSSDGGSATAATRPGDDAFDDEGYGHALVIDHDPMVRAFARDTLGRMGFTVTFSDTPQLAEAELERQEYEVVILDYGIAGAGGCRGALRAIKSRQPETEVIVTAGVADLRDAVKTIRHGAFDFLPKPYSRGDLTLAVASALRERHESGWAVISAGDEAPPGYRAIRPIAAGAMGAVSLVEKDCRFYAMKALRLTEGTTERREAIRRFSKEAELLSKLDHPGIVKVFEHGVLPKSGAPYFIMEYLTGHPLTYCLGDKSISILDKVRVIRGLADALAYLREQRIAHRDVKPGNVMFLEDKTAKIMDFGIASEDGSTTTISQNLVGSPAYMAPERFEEKESFIDIDPWMSDLFSLGVLSYEFFSGKRPFGGRNMVEVIHAIRERQPAPLRNLVPEIPARLAKIIMKTLRKDPLQRYEFPAPFLDDLDACARELEMGKS